MAPTRKCLWPQIHWAVEILQPWFCSFISISEHSTLVTHFLPYLHFHLVWPPLCLVFSPWWHLSHSLPPCPGVPQKCPSFLKFFHGIFYLSPHPYWNPDFLWQHHFPPKLSKRVFFLLLPTSHSPGSLSHPKPRSLLTYTGLPFSAIKVLMKRNNNNFLSHFLFISITISLVHALRIFNSEHCTWLSSDPSTFLSFPFSTGPPGISVWSTKLMSLQRMCSVTYKVKLKCLAVKIFICFDLVN